jgi:hypothetical protein
MKIEVIVPKVLRTYPCRDGTILKRGGIYIREFFLFFSEAAPFPSPKALIYRTFETLFSEEGGSVIHFGKKMVELLFILRLRETPLQVPGAPARCFRGVERGNDAFHRGNSCEKGCG